jgi:hypothetical protein
MNVKINSHQFLLVMPILYHCFSSNIYSSSNLVASYVINITIQAVKSSTILERALEKGTLGGEGSANAKKQKKNKKAAKKLK